MALAADLPEEAIERLERLQASPVPTLSASRYAAVLADNARLDEAWTVTTRGLAIWPDDLDLRIVAARLALTRGDPGPAGPGRSSWRHWRQKARALSY